MARGALARPQANAIAERRTIVFVDEAALYLLPALCRTYAPVGETPILSVPLTRDHLSAISAITPEGRLFTREYEHSIRSEQVIEFVRHLMRFLDRALLIWDGAPIHKSQQVKAFLSEVGERVQVEPLPPYAPELNPAEGIWRHLKRVELKNLCCDHFAHLKHEYRKAKERLRHKRHIIHACFAHAGVT
jgi:transposase